LSQIDVKIYSLLQDVEWQVGMQKVIGPGVLHYSTKSDLIEYIPICKAAEEQERRDLVAEQQRQEEKNKAEQDLFKAQQKYQEETQQVIKQFLEQQRDDTKESDTNRRILVQDYMTQIGTTALYTPSLSANLLSKEKNMKKMMQHILQLYKITLLELVFPPFALPLWLI
jgi:hypothetical protein